MIVRSAVLLFTSLQAVPALAGAQGSTLQARLQRVVDSVVAGQGLPGATAAVSIDGRVITVAAGMADRERGLAMTPEHRMLVGSAGKPFFAYIALSLAREGRLDLDAPVARWLGSEPWFHRLPNAAALTMRILLAHRGGIANHVADSAFAAAMRSSPEKRSRGFTAEEQIAFVLDRPAPFAAGDSFLYTDTGYLVAALALERATGQRYYRLLNDRVLKVLHLDHTTPSTRPDLPGLPQGYLAPSQGTETKGLGAWGLPHCIVSHHRLALNPVYEWTGGGLVSTSADLARWIETLFETAPYRVAGDSMVHALPPGANYGLGIFVRTTADGRQYWHPGGYPGYSTQIVYLPELGVAVAFQVNTERFDGSGLLHAIIETVKASPTR
jgi:D-alanyl-D-alanine carboxypeptidase